MESSKLHFDTWYHKVQALKLTYKSTIIKLSESFVEKFLRADLMCQPEGCEGLDKVEVE